jgi:hypothetical protein
MEKAKFALLIALFMGGIVTSVRYIHQTGAKYRNLMAPPAAAEGGAPAGPPIAGIFAAPKGPLEPPIGEERAQDVWDFDMPNFILTERRATMSDVKTAYYFIPERCLKCHEEAGPGQHFYNNDKFTEFKVFTTDDGLMLHSVIEKGETPTTKYIYKERHLKKVPFDEGAPLDVYMKRGY